MALDALCGLPQRRGPRNVGGNCRGLRMALPADEEALHEELESLQLADKGEMDPMQILRPPFVSIKIKQLNICKCILIRVNLNRYFHAKNQFISLF